MLQMNKQYREQIEQVAIDNETYTDKSMKAVYKEQKKSLDSLLSLLGELYIKYSVDGVLKMTSKQKASVGLKTILKDIGRELGKSEVEKVKNTLTDVYEDTYYKNAYILEGGKKK